MRRQDSCPCLQMHFTAAAKAARCSQQRKQPPLLAGHKIHVHQAGTQKDGPSAADLRRLVAAFGGKVCCAAVLAGTPCSGPRTLMHIKWAEVHSWQRGAFWQRLCLIIQRRSVAGGWCTAVHHLCGVWEGQFTCGSIVCQDCERRLAAASS